MSDPDFYEMLEISPDATPEEVREAYRLLAMVWHPDRFPKDSKLWTHANEKMQQINEAYNALKNRSDPDSQSGVEQAGVTQPPRDQAQNQHDISEATRQVHEQERQQAEARRQAEELQQRIREQKAREEEQRRREAEVRIHEETEVRRVESERLRVLMQKAQKVEDVKRQRAELGLCPLCGQPMSPFEKLTRRNHHRDCSMFIDNSTDNSASNSL